MSSLGIGFDSFFDETLNGYGQMGKHVYIVYTDDQGVEYVLEGGTYAPATGLIVARQGLLSRDDVPDAAVPNFGADDNFIYKPSVVDTYVALDVADVEATWQAMQDHAQAINDAEIPYVFSPGPNSNSFAASVLNAVGLNVQEILDVSIPGDLTSSNIMSKAVAGEISMNHLGFIGLQNTLLVVDTTPPTEVISSSVTSGDDKITLSGNGETVDAGSGIDMVVYSTQKASITKTSNGFVVNGDTLINVERIQFSDANIALDTEGATSAGGIYRLYKATFNREPDESGLGYWIAQADAGNKDAVRMAEDFTWSQEFQDLYNITTTDNYGTGTDVEALVTGFYENVLGRTPDEGGLNFYTGVIESKERTVGRVLAEISDSPENYDATIELIQNGIQYDLWVG